MGSNKALAVERRIRNAIVGLRPLLRLHEQDVVDLLSFDLESGVVILQLDGGCPDCDMPTAALMTGIEAHLMIRVPEIRSVRLDAAGGRSHG